MAFYKDESLDALAQSGNVAQFVSYRPIGGEQRLHQTFSRVAGYGPNHQFRAASEAIEALLASSSDGTVNVRSFLPDNPRSQEFVYGISRVADVLSVMERLRKHDLCLIINETIDVSDGGVSGVVQGSVVEFAPDDTPRCVEKPGVASLAFPAAMDILTKVYGFVPDLQPMPSGRAEFSIHPKPRGWRGAHTILWELERGVAEAPSPSLVWPNRFSRHIGDKLFGLLVADHLGLPVPRTLAIGRRVAPFSFGIETGSMEVWTRTCPMEPQPGLYTTTKGWTDPFRLLSEEDPDGEAIASVICQAAVRAAYSGAAIVGADGTLIVEGRRGEGDRLMLGVDAPEALPETIVQDIRRTYDEIQRELGAARFEWVHDGDKVWIVQLHRGGTATGEGVLVPGEAELWIDFDVRLGLEAIREALTNLPEEAGIALRGDVGVTSHVADLVRRAGRPAKLASR